MSEDRVTTVISPEFLTRVEARIARGMARDRAWAEAFYSSWVLIWPEFFEAWECSLGFAPRRKGHGRDELH
jgi:hypothetical protein